MAAPTQAIQSLADDQAHDQRHEPDIGFDMALVDCGWSAGTMTIDLAEIVAPGAALGIDIRVDALAQARKLASERDFENVCFEEASIYAIPCADASVDAVFIHAVLHHLSKPQAALSEVLRVLKPGGVTGVREPDFTARVLGPAGSSTEIYELSAEMLKRNGGNPYIGRELRKLLYFAWRHVCIDQHMRFVERRHLIHS